MKGENLMDTSNILVDEITTNGGWHFGKSSAPIKVVEFINLRCPYSKLWWKKAEKILDPYVKDGKVERIVKHFDKEKPSLRKGNVLHHHLSYEDIEETRKNLDFIIDHLDDWGDLEEEEVANWAKDKLGLDVQMNAEESSEVIEEASNANVTFVPTIFIEDYIFDENIPDEELKQILDIKLDKGETKEQ